MSYGKTAIAVVLFLLPLRAWGIEVTASVDRTQLAVGESAVLTITVDGTRNAPAPATQGLTAFQVQYQGPATQVSWVNGKMTASVSHRYLLVARKAGAFDVGPFEVDLGGKQYRTAPIRVQVTAAAQPPTQQGRGARASGQPWLEIVAAKREPYVGERIPLVVKLYVGRTEVEQLQFPKIAGEGFVLGTLPQPIERSEVVGGIRHRVLVFNTTITPLRAGELAVGPATMSMVQLVNRRRRGMFDDFFSDVFAERRPFEATGRPLALTVRPLPAEGKPAGFGGAVGHFDFSLEAKPLELNAGDPITVRMQISGDGDLSALEAPRIPVGGDFRAYDPVPVKGDEGPGRRVFEQVLIPREAAVKALPAVSFSFFDPGERQYRTITRGPVALAVRPAAGGSAAGAPQVLLPEQEARPEPTPERLGRDIVYIKRVPGTLRAAGAGLLSGWRFVAVQLLPVVLFAALAAYTRRRDRLRADPRLLRFRLAGREARRALVVLGRNESDGAPFLDALAAAVHEYLAAKLGLPPGAVDVDRVVSCLDGNAGTQVVRENVESFFALVERARYGAVTGAESDRAEALRLARAIVDGLERERRLAGGLTVAVIAAAIVMLLGGWAPTRAQKAPPDSETLDPTALFYEGNAAYKAGRYDDAVAAYQRAVDAGFASGALYFNLGNAWFKSGKPGEAVLNYERALRLLPRDPDIKTNLAYARDLAADAELGPPLWQRALFPLAGRATTSELAWLCTALWWLFWGMLALRLFAPRQRLGLGRAAIVVGLVAVLSAANFVARLSSVDWRRTAVVTATGPVVVRFEPSPTGTEYFRVAEGVLLEVTDEREGWLQVRRRDGRRGWIPANAAGLV